MTSVFKPFKVFNPFSVPYSVLFGSSLAYQALLDLNPILLVPSINDARAEGRLWQDAAMTIPATAADDPVGAVEDFSGNGYHLTADGDARPLLKQDGNGHWYILPDGTNDTLATAAIDLTGTQAITIVRAYKRGLGTACFISSSANAEATAGAFEIFDDYSGFMFLATGNSGYTSSRTDSITAANHVNSIVCDFALATNEVSVTRIDGSDAIIGRTHNTNNSGAFGDHAVHLFRSVASGFYSGNGCYSLALFPSALTVPQIQTVESYMAANSGVTL
jgi:hypothetical protein